MLQLQWLVGLFEGFPHLIILDFERIISRVSGAERIFSRPKVEEDEFAGGICLCFAADPALPAEQRDFDIGDWRAIIDEPHMPAKI
jgi:hypothetical protein